MALAASSSAYGAWAAVTVAVVGVFVSSLQFCATRQQIRTAARAWVTLSHAGGFSEGGNALNVSIKNTGQGPALDVTAPTRLSTLLASDAPPDADAVLDKIEKEVQIRTVMGAGSEVPIGVFPSPENLAIPPEHAVLFGRISYHDQFGDRHKTRFCVAYAKTTNIWQPCPNFNGAD